MDQVVAQALTLCAKLAGTRRRELIQAPRRPQILPAVGMEALTREAS
jgi:hypothetical protein